MALSRICIDRIPFLFSRAIRRVTVFWMSEFKRNEKKYRVGIVGATGAVGLELINVLYDRQFPVQELHLYASARSAGNVLSTKFGDLQIQVFSLDAARHNDYVFLAVSGDFALQYSKSLSEGDGPVVIDNSSAFRYDADIPLVVSKRN